MHTDTPESGSSPFAENVNIYYYFPLPAQDRVLEQMVEAVTDSVPLITLNGDEGSGKTMLCKLLQSRIPQHVVCVFLPSRVESFEDVLRLIIQEVGVGFSQDGEELSREERLEAVRQHLEQSGQKLLIIFDEAENVYLATLERARKMLDQVNAAGNIFTLLLAGRTMLQENLKQLSIVNFSSIQEKHFTLSPLTAEETWQYLNNAMKRVNKPGAGEAFSREASDKIFSMARGNFRMTNILAEEALQNANADTSFMALLDNISDEPEKGTKKIKRRLQLSQGAWTRKKSMQVGGTAGAILIVLLLLFFSGGQDADDPIADTAPAEIILEEKPVVTKKEETTMISPVAPEQESENPPEAQEDKEPLVAVVKDEEQPEETKEVVVPADVEIPTAIEESEPVASKPKTISSEKVVKDRYVERIAAGNNWLEGGSTDKYTIQLMVLTSDGAEKNLRKLLLSDDYKQYLDEMYILQKSGTSLPILVFFGEYPSMTAARNARNTLPQLLRKHHPYAIAVKGAVQKVL